MESSSPPTPTLHSSPNRLRAQVHKLHDELSHSHQTHSKLYADLSEKEAEIRRLKQEAKHWKSQCTQLRHYAEEQDQHYSSTSTRQKEDAESVVVKLRMESRQYQAEVCRLEGELSLSQQELEGVNQMYHTLKQEYESANCEWRTEMEELKEALQETSLGHAALIESSDVQQRMLQEQIVQLEHQLGQMKQENESFLNLLHVKTLSGEMDLSGHTRRCSGNDELLSPATSGTTLADELMSVNSASEQGRTEMEYRLRVLEEDNRALLLYINRILSRIMESDDERIKHVLNNSNAREML